MTAEAKRGDALQFIFSLFLGILLVVFIGVGVWTFYEEPDLRDDPAQEELDRLYREQGRLETKGMGEDGKPNMTPADDKRYEELQERIEDLQDEVNVSRDIWARNTSIILIGFATLLMAVSLGLPDTMRVFSNGFLLGGMFTLIYGTGWSFASEDSRARFYVVLVALLLSVGFGYLRFIDARRDKAAAAAASAAQATSSASATSSSAPDASALADLATRVSELERRTSAAADALGLERRD